MLLSNFDFDFKLEFKDLLDLFDFSVDSLASFCFSQLFLKLSLNCLSLKLPSNFVYSDLLGD